MAWQRLPGRRGVVPEHVGVELPPGQFGAEDVGAGPGGQAGQDLARVDGAEAEVGREPRRALMVGPVPLVLVPAHRAGHEPVHGGLRRRLPGHRQRGGLGPDADGLDTDVRTGARASVPRPAPPTDRANRPPPRPGGTG